MKPVTVRRRGSVYGGREILMKTKVQADDTMTLHYAPEAVWAVIFDIRTIRVASFA